MKNNLGSRSHYIRYVRTKEFERDFPLVYLVDGKVSFSLLSFTKEQMDIGRGKDAALRRIFKVVADIYQFYQANEDKHQDYLNRGHELIIDYFSAKLHGTIKNGVCDLGLFWKRTKYADVRKGITQFQKYQSYCKTYLNVAELVSDDMIHQMTVKYSAFEKKTNFKILEHIASVKDAMDDDQNQTSLDYDNDAFDQSNSKIVKYFPPKKLKEFIDSEENINYKAAFLLCSFTGLRESEHLHILVNDIVYRGNLAEVIISDPNTGNTFSLEKNKQVPRTEILSSCLHQHKAVSDLDDINIDYLSRLPVRTNLHIKHRYFSGWKGVQLRVPDKKYGHLLEWTCGYAQELFTSLVRKLLMQKRLSHPYLLCNTENGMPMTIDAYESRFRRHSAKVTGKELYSHVMRHFTGFYCANVLRVDQDEAKRYLRHKRRSSTDIYYNLSPEEVKRKIAMKETSIWDELDFSDWGNK